MSTTSQQPEFKGGTPKQTRVRRLLVAQFGGRCQRCNYDRCPRALQFHHKDSSEKKEWSGRRGNASTDEIRAHPDRFLLLCANCHFEVHEEEYKANRLYLTCEVCGQTFPSYPYKLKNGRGKFCSIACAKRKYSEDTPDRITVRFLDNIAMSGDCWEWTGKTIGGCPVMTALRSNGKNNHNSARRISHEIHVGPVPEGMEVMRCRANPLCVNPDHLSLGTRSDLRRLIAERGNEVRGELSHHAKVSEGQVREIRRRYAAGGISQAKLGKEFGLSQITVGEIVRRVIWKHVK